MDKNQTELKLSELSFADLTALYNWYKGTFSLDDGNEKWEQFKRIGNEIRDRISRINFDT